MKCFNEQLSVILLELKQETEGFWLVSMYSHTWVYGSDNLTFWWTFCFVGETILFEQLLLSSSNSGKGEILDFQDNFLTAIIIMVLTAIIIIVT